MFDWYCSFQLVVVAAHGGLSNVREDKFNRLCKRLHNSPNAEDIDEIIRHAQALRGEIRMFINREDTWDQEWDIIGYDPSEGLE